MTTAPEHTQPLGREERLVEEARAIANRAGRPYGPVITELAGRIGSLEADLGNMHIWSERAQTAEAALAEMTKERDGACDMRDAYSAALKDLQDDDHVRAARQIVDFMAREFYPEVTEFKPFDGLSGLLSQIDNMTTGLCRVQTASPESPSVSQEDISALLQDVEGVLEPFAAATFLFGDHHPDSRGVWLEVDDKDRRGSVSPRVADFRRASALLSRIREGNISSVAESGSTASPKSESGAGH